LQKVLAGCGIVAILVAARNLPGQARAPLSLHHDHTREWAYVREPHTRASGDERFLADVASLVARRPVEVRCEDFSIGSPEEPGGVVQFNGSQPADYARIRPDICTALLRFRSNPAGDVTPQAGEALTVLAHESEHLAGVRNEAAAQCYAIQDLPRVARAFGASTEDGARMADFEYTVALPKMPPAYRSPECRPGGALDHRHAGAAITAPSR
jgi:hypothetical protein